MIQSKIVNFSSEITQGRMQCDDIVKVLKRKKSLLTKNSISGEIALQKNGEIQISPDKLKLREFIISRPALQEMLTGVLQAETRALDGNLNPNEEKRSLVKRTTKINIKASISLLWVCNSSFCFLYDLKYINA